MILDIYKDSFEYASKNVKNLLILGVFYLFGFLVIHMFFILGYNYRIIKIATEGMINGNDELPEFEDWPLMLVEGILVFVVYVAVTLCCRGEFLCFILFDFSLIFNSFLNAGFGYHVRCFSVGFGLFFC